MMRSPVNPNKVLAVVAALVFIWFVYRLSDAHLYTDDEPPPPPPPQEPGPRPPMSSQWNHGPPEDLPANNATDIRVYEGKAAEDYCERYRFKPFDPERVGRRKIYDLLLINTEIEMLEVRIGEMYPYVDYFIIMEADVTFTGNAKKLYIAENWDIYAKYHDKMIRRTVDFSELKENPNAWAREELSRNAMMTQVLPFLEGDQAPSEDDVLLVSDVDEIPKPAVLEALRNCEVPLRITINSDFYYYSFEWLSREEWKSPQATLWRGKETIQPNDLRIDADDYYFKHGAWHCSYCFSTMEETVGKVNSFSHQELNKPEFKDPKKILQRVRFGKDL